MRKVSKTVRIEDVAKEAGVSAATVSYVLNNRGSVSPETRARVIEVATRLRYRPSAAGRDLASRVSHALGIVVPRTDSLSDPFFATLLSGFMVGAQTRGYQVVLLPPSTGPEDIAEMAEGRLDGVLLLDVEEDDKRVSQLHDSSTPVLLFGRSDLPVAWIDVDSQQGGAMATRHLLELGHRRIAHIAAPQRYLYGRLRQQGYEEALRRFDAAITPIVLEGDLTMESGYRLARELLVRHPRPTAIFAASDLMAIGAIRAASDVGLTVPQELSVVGFDDSYVAREFIPTLTTIAQNPHLLGERLAERLVEQVANGSSRHELVAPQLVVRESSGDRRPAPRFQRSSERLTLKAGASFSLWSDEGFIERGSGNQGIYGADTHWLSHYQIQVNGVIPTPVSLALRPDGFHMRYVVALEDGTLDIEREVAFRPQALTDSWNWTRWGDPHGPWTVDMEHAVDFRDIFELRGYPVERHGSIHSDLVGPSAERHQYQGTDSIQRVFSLSVQPDPQVSEIGVKRWTVGQDLRHGRFEVNMSWTLPAALSVTQSPRRDWLAVEVQHPVWQRVLLQSQRDIDMLLTDYGQGPVLVAGLPWFGTFFGRDALISAYQILWARPDVAEATLAMMAHLQGNIADPKRSEMPGKMVHEVRLGELANSGVVPFGRYYGSVDVTPLFIMTLHDLWRMTGRQELLTRYLPVARRSMAWMQQALSENRNGLLTFHSGEDRGLTVQSWKDSSDSMVYHDGTQAESPLAVAEVQGYVFKALYAMADMEEAVGDAVVGMEHRKTADRLQETFHQGFWMAEQRYYAMAVDRYGKRLEVASSDPGQCLWTGIVPPDVQGAVVDRLMQPDLFSGWGIRTLGMGERAYDPYSYHRGSVWPHDTSLVVAGMAQCGFLKEAATVASGLVDAAHDFPDQRLPELFSGIARDGAESRPLPYPYACAPQAWAAGAPWLMLKSLLRLEIDGVHRILTLGTAPAQLGSVAIRGLTVDGGEFDLDIDQHTVHVLRQPEGWTTRILEQ